MTSDSFMGVDALTNQAAGGIAAYPRLNGLIEDPCFYAEQGQWKQRPGRAGVRAVGPADVINTIKGDGPAIAVPRVWLEPPAES